MFLMNFDPAKFCYFIVPAYPAAGANVVLVRLDKRQVRVFYAVNHGADSAGLRQHMDSMTDELLLDFFEKKKKPKNPDGRKPKKDKDG